MYEPIAPKVPKTTITLRPHHLLCTVGFQGKGYSASFVENYSSLKDFLDTNPQVKITIQFSTDDVCKPCPHNRGEGLCRKESIIQRLDQKHSSILDLRGGDILTWAEGLERIKSEMTLENFHRACDGCEWKDLGICEDALRSLISLKTDI